MLRTILTAFIAVLAFGVCAAAPATHFSVNQFVLVALEYDAHSSLAGVDTYGPAPSTFRCTVAATHAIIDADKQLPKGHTLVTTCLHVMFGGPLPKGAAVAIPSKKAPPEYITVGVEYGPGGKFVGAQALHASLTIKTCMHESKSVLQSNYADGHVSAGNSLILYCVPVPSDLDKTDGHAV
jgi:hypothetical protein